VGEIDDGQTLIDSDPPDRHIGEIGNGIPVSRWDRIIRATNQYAQLAPI